MSVDKGGRLAGQSTSPTLPQDATGEAGQCQRTSGSKPPTSIDIRQALRTYATKLVNSREYQRGAPDMRQHGDRMLAECLAFENEIADEIERLRARVAELEADAERFAWYVGGNHTESNALVDLALRQISGDYPTLDEYRAAIDAARTAPSAGSARG